MEAGGTWAGSEVSHEIHAFMHLCFAGLRLALHPTQALGPLAPTAAPPHSVPTPATLPSAAPSVAAAPGTQECVCVSE